MDNKYEVITEEIIDKNTILYTIKNIYTKEEYSCLIESNSDNTRVLLDDNANIYDTAEALFQYDLDLYNKLPKYMITPNIVRCYEDYYPGKGNCNFRDDSDYQGAYKFEEERINKLEKGTKKLIK